MPNTYDVIIIGSGPGGYVTAIRSAQLGFKTAIIEREHLGGICLNWGCIPAKALLRSAEVKNFISHAENYGLKVDGTVQASLSSIVARSRSVSQRLNQGVGFLMKKHNIDIIWGEAKLKPSKKENYAAQIDVKSMEKTPQIPQHPFPKTDLGAGSYYGKHIIIATGARPRILEGLEPDQDYIWTYFEALKPKTLPKKLLIVGSGAIGTEFASFYHDMGSEVILIEMMEEIMPAEDKEIAKFVRQKFEKRGIKIWCNSKIQKAEKNNKGLNVILEKNGKKESLICDNIICAVGVQGNIENLGLETLNVKTEKSCICVDPFGKTNIPGIYAIGDVAGAPMLAHKAEEEGVICIEKIAQLPNVHPLDKSKIPGCTYCMPQVASVGLTEEKAKQMGLEIRVGRYSFSANGKAIAMGEDQGMVKTIFDKKTGQLLGAHMVGAEVTELIQGFVIAMNLETTEEELFQTIFPHPTLSEMMKESALDAFGRVLNA